MIQPQTYLTVADNTGARKIMCIRILGNNKKYGNIGEDEKKSSSSKTSSNSESSSSNMNVNDNNNNNGT